jgi:putative aldouronate transport system permease protein
MAKSTRPVYEKQTAAGTAFDAANGILLTAIVIVMLYPFLNVTALSFNNGFDAILGGIYLWPRVWTLENFEFAIRSPGMLRGAWVSVLRTAVGTGATVLGSVLLGYIVSCQNFMGRKLMRVIFIVTMYFSGGLIPTYLLMLRLGFVNSFNVFWVPHIFSAFYMILASSYIQNIPEALFESAKIDGARELRILIQFVIPLSLPMLACIAIYAGVGQWNSWFDVNLYSKNGRWDNLQIILYRLINQTNLISMITDQKQISDMMRSVQPVTVRSAVTVLVTFPIIVIYPFFQRYFVSGITLGAVKQ